MEQNLDEKYTILVSDLSPETTSKQISDFFSFCGKIVSLTLRKKEESAEAIVSFENEASAKTALLLDNALINDKAMTVVMYTEVKQEAHEEEDKTAEKLREEGSNPDIVVNEVADENITQREGGNRTATATIASILASGYILGVDTLSRARKVDEDQRISESVGVGASNLKQKISDVDREYGISEKAGNTSRSIGQQWETFDQQNGISQNASAVAESVGNTMSSWGSFVAQGISSTFQQPSVQRSLSSVTEWTNNVGKSIGEYLQPATDSVLREYEDIKEQTSREIEIKQKERMQHEEVLEMNDLKEGAMDEEPKKLFVEEDEEEKLIE